MRKYFADLTGQNFINLRYCLGFHHRSIWEQLLDCLQYWYTYIKHSSSYVK